MIDDSFLLGLRYTYGSSAYGAAEAKGIEKFLNIFYDDTNLQSYEQEFYTKFKGYSDAQYIQGKIKKLKFSGQTSEEEKLNKISEALRLLNERGPNDPTFKANVQQLMNSGTNADIKSINQLISGYNDSLAKELQLQAEVVKGTVFEHTLDYLLTNFKGKVDEQIAKVIGELQNQIGGSSGKITAKGNVTGGDTVQRMSQGQIDAFLKEQTLVKKDKMAQLRCLLKPSLKAVQQKADISIENYILQFNENVQIDYSKNLRISAKAWSDISSGDFGETDVFNGLVRSGASSDLLNKVAKSDEPQYHTVAKQMLAADIILGYGQAGKKADANFIIIRDNSARRVKVISAAQIVDRIINIANDDSGIQGYDINKWQKKRSPIYNCLARMAKTKVSIASGFLKGLSS